ncbi:MAG: outer membrane protein OmpA-like peptidoglycan-associated protein [Saprospiraceae bacterium]|jgi:outer membrane protein OmpA-like peptidoglycan-associated protein
MRLSLGILVFLVWASICRYGYVCQIKQHCDPEPAEALRAKTLDLVLDDTITFLKDYDQFVFREGLIQPGLNDNNKAYLDSLASVMKSDTTIFLTITGRYRLSETGKGSGMFEDFGMARAAEIRKLIAQRDVSEDKISLDSKSGNGEELIRPLEFSLYTDRSGTPDEYAKIKYTFTNMTFSDANFEKNSPVFNPGEALILYADSVKTYLGLNPDNTLTIIGHCDSDGTDQYNLELGKHRAENTKKYFVDLGVTSKIVTQSKGETEPAFPNDSEINMQKNRRVNFVIE